MVAARRAIGCIDRVIGGLLMTRQRRFGGGAVLLYHRVSPIVDPSFPPLHPEVFESHCRLIRRNFTVLPLGEFVQRQRAGRSLNGCCAVTFDDGYGEFLEFAYPALARHEIPVTQFLVLDCLLSGRTTWTQRLNRLLFLGAGTGERYESAGDRVAQLKIDLARMPVAERYGWLTEQESKIEMDPPEPRMLTVPELKRCDPGLVAWGSHTVTHAMLAQCDPATVETELRESRRALEEQIGMPIRHLSYPNNSYTPDVTRMADACGYDAAFAVDQLEIRAGAYRYALPRFDIGHMTTRMVRLELSGALAPLRNLRAALQVRSA